MRTKGLAYAGMGPGKPARLHKERSDMEYIIPRVDGHLALADAIEQAENGDTIVCLSEAMQSLGEKARMRMCPEKNVLFTLEG